MIKSSVKIVCFAFWEDEFPQSEQYKTRPPFETKAKHRAWSSCPGHAKGRMNTILLTLSGACFPISSPEDTWTTLPSKTAAGLAHRRLGVPRRNHIEQRSIIMCPLDGQTRCGYYQITWGVESGGSKRLDMFSRWVYHSNKHRPINGTKE